MMAKTQKATRKRKNASPQVVVSPPQCPYCKKQGCKKRGGAFRQATFDSLGVHQKWFRVLCNHCTRAYVVIEKTVIDTESV